MSGPAEFRPNPHLSGYNLTVTHDPEMAKKMKRGHLAQPIKLEHLSFGGGNTYVAEAVLGWAVTMGTPTRNQYRIMTNAFGVGARGSIIIRDKFILEALTSYFGQQFTLVSNRNARTEALVKWALDQKCGAIYTPEGYDDYLLDRIKDEMIKQGYRGQLLTYLDGGIVIHHQTKQPEKVLDFKRA